MNPFENFRKGQRYLGIVRKTNYFLLTTIHYLLYLRHESRSGTS